MQGTTLEPDLRSEVEWYTGVDPEEVEDNDGLLTQFNLSPSEFTEFALNMPTGGEYRPFSFEGRSYLRQIYDTPTNRRIVIAGRQVEKTQSVNALTLLEDGRIRAAGDIKVGDRLACLEMPAGARSTTGEVNWVSRRYRKPCLRITTRQGHQCEVATTHPMRAWDAWVESSLLQVGDKLAVVRAAGKFLDESTAPQARIVLTAYAIADGGLGGSSIVITKYSGPVQDDLLYWVAQSGSTYAFVDDSRSAVRVHKGSLTSWLEADGLLGKLSADKFIPDWVFGLSRKDTSLFLNRLWACDGHVKCITASKYDLVYSSISLRLVRQVQALLWKFGIPTSYRSYVPEVYEGTDKVHHMLRVETQEGVRRFLMEIGALGKSDHILPPDGPENNNRDTYPKEGIDRLLEQICCSKPGNQKAPWRGRFYEAGLRRTLKYCPTKEKLQQYVDFFKEEGGFDQKLLGRLEQHISTDVYWDEIERIEDIGEQECVDFQVEDHHNFVIDGFFTHNSTLLGNQILAYCALNPGFRTLYVSPSHQQTKVFSRDRIKEPIDTSNVLKSMTNSKLLANVLEKKFVNRSQVTLRFAFLNADRVRGIPADYILIDEFQDIILENVPVIEECASHSSYKFFTYSGTPKSLDNPLEFYYRRFSTQNEWVVPCKAHGTPKDPSTWYWNVLDEDNIGKKSLVCDKCQRQIYAADPDACWAAMNPNPNVEKPFEGFRIPQIMVPWIDWDDILDKQRKYSRPKFFNEVLGLSYDSGVRPLTQQDIMGNCNPKLSMDHYKRVAELYKGQVPIFMGIDWGCHDDQTRILTEHGFKYFRDVKYGERVAQFDKDTREMTLVEPEALTVRDWDGDLLHYEGRALDMMLTGTHRMLVKGKGATRWSVESASENIQRAGQVHFRGSVRWEGVEQEIFTLPGLPSSAGYSGCEPRTFAMDDWLEFLGYFLSEGGLCMTPSRSDPSVRRPYCLKMSQRESVNPVQAAKIKGCLDRMGIEYQEYPNDETGDLNWTICGKQFWHWVELNVGGSGDTKRIPREFLALSSRQLRILFDAMMLGDGSEDPREGNFNGYYGSTSKGLCEDFQELCIRLSLRSTLSLHKPAEGNRKARFRVSWSAGDDHAFNEPSKNVHRVPYKGKVYCCKVSSGFIVTERNGRIAYQGNTGEGTYTVIVLGGYLPWDPEKFTIFYAHRFEGPESEPRRQLDIIKDLVKEFNVSFIGADYGGGHWPNDELLREYGFERVKKYQWVGNVKKKISFEPRLTIPRFLCHRTETMSDIFNAIKRKEVFSFPRWQEFADPYASDMLNIFSEFNDRLRMNVFKHAPGMPDDTFHAIAFCFLVSFHYRRRPDVVAPTKEVEREAGRQNAEDDELDIDL